MLLSLLGENKGGAEMPCCVPDQPKAEMIAMMKKAHLDLKSSANTKKDARR